MSVRPSEKLPPSGEGREIFNSIGVRLRSLRLARAIGVRELARRAGVTPGLLSQIEKGTVNPSVGTLFKLAECLETSTDWFFSHGEDSISFATAIVPRAARARIQLSEGVAWERLTPTDEHDFEFMEVVYPPGAASGIGMQQHAGRDYGLVLEGTLTLAVGSTVHQLNPTDSFAFDAGLPHRLSNTAFTPVRFVSIVLDRTGFHRPVNTTGIAHHRAGSTPPAEGV